jgi:hypothetical protein
MANGLGFVDPYNLTPADCSSRRERSAQPSVFGIRKLRMCSSASLGHARAYNLVTNSTTWQSNKPPALTCYTMSISSCKFGSRSNLVASTPDVVLYSVQFDAGEGAPILVCCGADISSCKVSSGQNEDGAAAGTWICGARGKHPQLYSCNLSSTPLSRPRRASAVPASATTLAAPTTSCTAVARYQESTVMP